MEIRFVVAAAAAAMSVVIGSAPAQASLVGDTVQTASYLDVSYPPPAASPTECTIIDCNILDYQGSSGPTNSPLPTVPVTYLEDALTATTVSVGDTQITITNDLAGLFCPAAGCTPGDFSGYVFTFTGTPAPDITNVAVGSGSSSDFQPVAPPAGPPVGLTWTTNSITVNVAGDNLAVGDQLILDVTTGTTGSFTRTVSGNWTDATGWTPNGVPNGATVTAQLVNPASGTNNVNLGGGTFTVNQLQFSGTNAGTWTVTTGTIVFDGTNPTFLNQGDSSGLAGSLPNLTLNATTTFEIDNASAVTDVTGDITGAGGLIKTGAGTLTLTGTNTYAGGTTISAGTLQIGAGGTTGSIVGNVTDNSALAFDRSDNATFGGVISGTGSLTQLGLGTLTLTGSNSYTGGTTISAGTLALSGAGSIAGSSGVADNSAFDISGTTAGASITTLSGSGTVALGAQTLTLTNQSSTFAGVIGGSGGLTLTGAGTETLTGANTYSGGTTIAAGTLQIGGAGSLGGGSYAGAITDNGTLQYSSSASQTLSGVISGAGALTKDTSTSTLTLTGANTYAGGTSISAGTLQIGAGGTTGSIVGNVTDNSALAFDRSDNATFGGVISGTGSLTQLGLGTLTLTGSNSYTGGTTISAGTLALSGAGSIAGSSGVADNSAFDISGTTAGASITTLSGSGTVALGAQTLTLTNQSSTFAGVIGGSGGLTLTGAGTETLTGANTYSGGTTIAAGTLQIGGAGSLGGGSYAGAITDNGTLQYSSSASQTLSGVISGAGALTKDTSTSTLTLTGANTYAGGTSISAGTLQIGAGGTTGSIVGNVTDNSALAFDRSDNATFGGVISGTGSLTQLGLGTLTLTGSNSYTGGTTISAGTLALSGAGSIAGSSGVADNSAFDISGTTAGASITTLSGSGTVALGAQTLTLTNQSSTFAGVIGGSGGLTLTGAGTETLTGANTYSGGTTIAAGTLQIGGAGSLGGGSYAGAITDNGTLQYSSSASQTLSGVISGAGALTKDTSTSTLTLTGANTYAGGTSISAGTLQIGAGGTTGSIVGNVTDNSALAFDRSDNATFGGVISGTGSLTQLGLGTLTLTGSNSYTGGTTISAGTLALSGAGSIAGSSGVADNSAFDISGTTAGASITTLSGSGTVALGAQTLTLTNQSSTFAGVIGGSGGLTLTGAGTETLTGANTYSGGTTIAAGTLQIGAGGTSGSIVGNVADNSALAFDRSDNMTFGGVISGSGSLAQLGGGTLTLTGANTYTGGTTISAGALQLGTGGTSGSIVGNVADNGVLAFDRSDSVTFGGVISGTGSVLQAGAGATILTGANTYTGGTTISAGTLQLGNGGTSGSIVGNVADNGALAFDRSDSVTFGSVISGTGSVLQEGAGATILTSANSYSGGTTVVNGTLGVGANGALGTGLVELFTDATLAFTANGLNLANAVVLEGSLDPTIDTGANTDTISGVISGPGSLAKIGSGTLILSAANTYAGATDVQAGTLAVTGSIVSSATVESGATLGGSGTIGGLVAKSGATIAPGVLAPFSTLTVNGAASFAAGSIFAVNVNAAGQNDKLVTTGATTISGGTVQVTPAPGTYAPQTRYTLITAGGGVSGTFNAATGLSSLAFLSPALSYDADDVYLGFSVKTTPSSTPLFASIAQTPNQSAIALALQAQPPGSPLFDAIIGQTVAGAVAAFDALSGEIHASAVSAAFDDQRLPREAVFDRLATPYGGAVAGGAQSVQTLAAPNPAQVFAAWGQAFDSWGHIGGDGNAATLSNNLGGLIFGADATLQGRYRLGVAGGYDYSTLGLGARSSSGNVSTTYVGLYGGLSDGALQLRGGGFYGYNHYGTSRTAVFPGFADALGSGYGGDTWQAFAEAGWRMPVGGLAAYSAWMEPFVGLTGLEIATRSFGESAGAAALNGASAAYNCGITTLGLRGEASLFAWTPLVANGMIGWQRAFGDVTPNSVLAFASAPDVPFAIAGAPIARNALAVEAGVDWRFTANVKLGIYYSGLIASNASDNAIKVKLEANF